MEERPKDHNYVRSEFLAWSHCRENCDGCEYDADKFPCRFSRKRYDIPLDELIESNIESAKALINKRSILGDSPIADKITIIVPSSVIPSHPSTEIIEESIQRVRGNLGRSGKELARCEILIMLDGVRSEQLSRLADYEEYKRRLIALCAHDPNFHGCVPIIFDKHAHQANMTRETLNMVKTPYIFFVEQDTFPTGEIDWNGIIGAIGNDDVNCIRLNIFHKILDEHKYLMLNNAVPITVNNISLIPTMQWSQRPHLAKASLYKWFLEKYFPPTCRTMIEDRIYPIIINDFMLRSLDFERWKIWIYAPVGDTIYRSGSSDGRKNDIKYNMIYE